MGCLKNLTIAVSGDVGNNPAQIKKWVEANSGRWVPRFTKDVTHLVCSKEHWRRKVESVTTAQEAGAHIVTWDWLETCLQNKKKVGERKYSWSGTVPKKKVDSKEERKEKKKRTRIAKAYDEQRFERGCEKARQDLDSGTQFPLSSAVSSEQSQFFSNTKAALARLRAQRAAETNGEAGSQDKEQDAVMKDAEGTQGAEGQNGDVERETHLFLTDPPSIPCHSSLPPTSALKFPDPNSADLTNTHNSNNTPNASQLSQSPSAAPKAEKLAENYHIYVDNEGLYYDILLVRANLCRNRSTKYNLRLFESNLVPHTFCTYVRYTPPPKDGDEVVTNALGIPILKPKPGAAKPATSQKIKTKLPPSNTADNTDTASDTSTARNPTYPHPGLLAAKAFLSSPTPRSDMKFAKLLTPLGSDFASAFAAFRAAFADLTFMTWEERLCGTSHELQKQRAKVLDREPFVYAKPKSGLPVGFAPKYLMDTGEQGAVVVVVDAEDVKKRFGAQELGLPGMDERLGVEGKFGGEIMREAARIKAEREREEDEARERERMEKKTKGKKTGNGKGVAKSESPGKAVFCGKRSNIKNLSLGAQMARQRMQAGMGTVGGGQRVAVGEGRATILDGTFKKGQSEPRSSRFFYDE